MSEEWEPFLNLIKRLSEATAPLGAHLMPQAVAFLPGVTADSKHRFTCAFEIDAEALAPPVPEAEEDPDSDPEARAVFDAIMEAEAEHERRAEAEELRQEMLRERENPLDLLDGDE